MRFREDVNGLRAIAVATVVLFHFGLKSFSGGFIGVDIFFVISGFLMTGIITRNLDESRFSLIQFYHARIRRITPALTAMIVALLIGGYFLLDPLIYRETARYTIWSLMFISNIVFASESGYFAPASERNWLLHTWSLSVEWQFYIVYPLWITVVARFGWMKQAPLLVLGVPFLVSIAASIVVSDLGGRYATYAFFSLPTRAWEMLAGGIVFVLANGRLNAIQRSPGRSKAIEAGGIVIILSSLVLFDSRTPWPSFYTLLPVIGSTLVILSRGGGVCSWSVANPGRWVGVLLHLPMALADPASSSIRFWLSRPAGNYRPYRAVGGDWDGVLPICRAESGSLDQYRNATGRYIGLDFH